MFVAFIHCCNYKCEEVLKALWIGLLSMVAFLNIQRLYCKCLSCSPNLLSFFIYFALGYIYHEAYELLQLVIISWSIWVIAIGNYIMKDWSPPMLFCSDKLSRSKFVLELFQWILCRWSVLQGIQSQVFVLAPRPIFLLLHLGITRFVYWL